MPTETKNPAKERAYRLPPALYRESIRLLSPRDVHGDQWRFLVGQAPIVRSCVRTLIMYLTNMKWRIVSEDDNLVEYFSKLLLTADKGAGWEVHLGRVLQDTMQLPFGGAAEFGHFPDGVVAWVQHIDAATMVPTYNDDLPYAQLDPWGAGRPPIPFKEEQIGRVRWQAESRYKSYGWTITPAADALPAIQALVRADTFWQGFLTDSPKAGILDVMDMTEEEARSWWESWQTLLAGPEPFKVAMLYGGGTDRQKPASFIPFRESPAEMKMMEVLKLYAQEVTACFGMTIGDLGLFDQDVRLAGASKFIDLTKRQGPAQLKKGIKTMIDTDILPDNATFEWDEPDTEDDLRKAQAANARATSLRTLADPMVGIINAIEGRRAAVTFGIIPEDALDEDFEAGATPMTDASMGNEDQPTGTNVNEDMEGRSYVPPRAFPVNSPIAREMTKVTDRLLAPVLRALSKRRIKALLDIGLTAWEEGPIAGDVVQRSRADAEAALVSALSNDNWWQSPNLVDDVTEILRRAYSEGLSEAAGDIERERLALGFGGIELSRTHFNLTNEITIDQLRNRSGAFITNLSESNRHHIVDAILRGVQEGRSSPAITREILADGVRKDMIETWRRRTVTIVGHEISWAESRAAVEQQRQLGLTKKRWHSIPGLACNLCAANDDDGAVPMEHLFRSVFGPTETVPGHPNCLTGDVHVSAESIAATSKRWYDGDILVIRTRAGNDLSCTPNHPILTSHGWVAARELVKGGYVVSSLRHEWMAVRSLNDNDVPPRIEDITESFRRSRPVTAVEMPTAAEHFHGDGIGSDIAVIHADGLLGDRNQAAIREHLSQFTLCGRHAQLLGLNSGGDLQAMFTTHKSTSTLTGELASKNRRMGRRHLSSTLVRSHPLPLEVLGLASIANVDIATEECIRNGLAAYPIPAREAIDRLAGEVIFDEVIEVDTLRDWNGHVYNLQTADQFYVANGIITHNCHCYADFDIAELRGLAENVDYWLGGEAN